MSRIDQALSKALGARGGKGPDAFLLDEYTHEARPQSPHRWAHEPATAAAGTKARARPSAGAVADRTPDAGWIHQHRRVCRALQMHRSAGANHNVVVLTSPEPLPAKAATAIALAGALAEAGSRVVIVDAEVQPPYVHELIGLPNRAGLADVGLHGCGAPEFRPLSPWVRVLTAGTPDVFGNAAIAGPGMTAVVNDCAGSFDWVVLVAPAVSALARPLLLTGFGGGIVLACDPTVPVATSAAAIHAVGSHHIVATLLVGLDESARS